MPGFSVPLLIFHSFTLARSPSFYSTLTLLSPHSIPFALKFQKIRISVEKNNNNNNVDDNRNKKKVTRIKNAQARPIFLVQGLRDGRTPDQSEKEYARYELHCDISHFGAMEERVWNVYYVTFGLAGKRAAHTHLRVCGREAPEHTNMNIQIWAILSARMWKIYRAKSHFQWH